MRYEERVAAALVEQVIVGARMIHAPSEESGQCDFTLVVSGKSFPLEVTAFTRQWVRHQYARIAGRDGDGLFVDRSLAANDWLVTLSHRSDPRAVRERIDAHLAAVEGEGRTEFDVGSDANDSDAVRALWLDLCVSDGTHMQWNPPGRIGLGYPGDGSMPVSDHVTEAIVQEAAKADNLRKLSMPAEERHLFVYVDWHGYPAHSAMQNGSMPNAFPAVSDVITHVWAAAPAGDGHVHILWAADRLSGWRNLGRLHAGNLGE
jgi:hypothetical protein